MTGREEAKKESDFQLNSDLEDEEEEEEWGDEADWSNADDADEARDIKDESAAYLEFLNEEVSDYD